MKKLFSYFILSMFLGSMTFGQLRDSILKDKAIRPGVKPNPTNWIRNTDYFSWKTFRVRFNVVSATNATSPIVSEATVNACMENLNNYFRQARMNFVSACSPVNYIKNSSYTNITEAQQDAQRTWLLTNHGKYDAINVYIVNDIQLLDKGFDVAGYTYHPMLNLNFIAIDRNNCLNCTLPHEMGHYLGLLHTHEAELFGKENVDGSNCRTAGDLLCDTRAAPRFYPFKPDVKVELGEQTGSTFRFGNALSTNPNLFVTVNGGSLPFYYHTKCNWEDMRKAVYGQGSCTGTAYKDPNIIPFNNIVINGQRDHVYLFRSSFSVNSFECHEVTFANGEGLPICRDVPSSLDPTIVYNFGGCRGCSYFGTEKDPKGQSYDPDKDNIMSYAGCSCVSKFTVEQISEMHYWAEKPYSTKKHIQFSPFQNFYDIIIENENITVNRFQWGQDIIISNTNIGNNVNAVFDHCNTTTITNDFNVALGVTLEIK